MQTTARRRLAWTHLCPLWYAQMPTRPPLKPLAKFKNGEEKKDLNPDITMRCNDDVKVAKCKDLIVSTENQEIIRMKAD